SCASGAISSRSIRSASCSPPTRTRISAGRSTPRSWSSGAPSSDSCPTPSRSRSRGAMPSTSIPRRVRLLLILSVLVCCAGCDRISKTYAESRLSSAQAVSFLGGSVRLQLAYNEGAFLSLGSTLPKPWRQAIFRGGVALVLAGLLAYAVFLGPSRPWPVCAAALVFAGGASNLADRLLYDG